MRFRLVIIAATFCGLFLSMPAYGQDTSDPTTDVKETIEVQREKTHDTKYPSLQFLKDHRVFLRSQLDLLSMQITRVRTDKAEMLDERYLRLQEMAKAIAAARDTVAAEQQLTAGRERLNSITELGELEGQLALMEKVLAEQRNRLLLLEEDFLGHQETALVVLIRGLAGKTAPAAIALGEEVDVVRIDLSPEQRASLERGGIAQIYHEFVEPREHVLTVSFSGPQWSEAPPVNLTVEAARDRLTFLELDLSQLDRNREALGLVTSVWYR